MKKMLCGVILGAVVAGTVVALTTPKNGSELREDIKIEAVKIKHQGDEVLVKTKHQSGEIINKASKMYEETYEKAVDTVHKLKDKKSKTEISEVEESISKIA